MKMWTFSLFIACVFAVLQCAYTIEGLNTYLVTPLVIAPTGILIPTYISTVQYESIPFHKRAKNNSVLLKLPYIVNGLTEDNAELIWGYNGGALTVGGPGDQSKCFAERVFSQNILTITLHLQDNCKQFFYIFIYFSSRKGWTIQPNRDF